MDSTTSRSCPRGARVTPTTSTSPGSSGHYRFELPLLASAMDGVVSPRTAGDHRQARRPRRPEPRGHLHPLRGRRRAARAHRRSCPRTSRRARCRRSTSEPIKPELIAAADPGDQGPAASSPPRSLTPQRVARVLRAGARRRARHPRHPGHGRLGRARLDRRAAPLNLKEFIARARRSRSSSAAVPATTRACT